MPEVLPSVYLIDLCFQGQRAALAAYLLVGPDGQAALIETGPTTTRAALLDGVRAAGVDPAGIADVVVTHIHLDHAGGAGALLRDDLPGARVLVHPAGLPHLVDPGKLLRSAARLYGERMEELRRRLREWTDAVRAGLAAGRTPEEMGIALRQCDATRPGTSPEGVHRLDLVAGHGMSVAGIARYISRQ